MADLYTPDWWRERLEAQLDQRAVQIQIFEAYYRGDHPLAFATSRFRETFGALFSAFADNWCELIVNASVERLKVEGFRFPSEEDDQEHEAGDREAWAIWQANNLDAASQLAHTEAVKCGVAYLMVAPALPMPWWRKLGRWWGRIFGVEVEIPRITVEHPLQTITATDPETGQRVAGLKKWLGDDNYGYCNLYLPDQIYRWRSQRELRNPGGSIQWEPRDQLPNPIGAVPIVELTNNPTLLGGGQSDLRSAIPLQNAINKQCADMIVASEFQAFRQRWATGIELPTDDTGEVDRQKFLSDIARVWTVADENAKFGEFGQVDLAPYVKAIEMLVQHLAAQTRTPPHYLLGQSGSFPSGESLKSTETGLVAKVRRKQTDFGDGYEEIMRLAFQTMGNEAKAEAMDAETLWSDPESRSEGERVDALLKMAGLRVPLEILWQRWGMSPQEIDRSKRLLGLPDRSTPLGQSQPATDLTVLPNVGALPQTQAGPQHVGAGGVPQPPAVVPTPSPP